VPVLSDAAIEHPAASWPSPDATTAIELNVPWHALRLDLCRTRVAGRSTIVNIEACAHGGLGGLKKRNLGASSGGYSAGGVVPTVRHAPLVRNGSAENTPPDKK
jgi:hypothetical protein